MIATIHIFKAGALLLALLFGVALVQGVGAVPKPIHTRLSIETRVNQDRDFCMNHADAHGFSVKYERNEDGSVKSATTKCLGGLADGHTCKHEANSFTCTLEPSPTQPSDHTTVGGGVLEDVEVIPSSDHGNLGGGTLATPEAGTSQTRVIVGAFQATTAQDDDEQP